MSWSMAFAPDGSASEEELAERWRSIRRLGAPDNEVPVAAGVSAVLGRSDDAAVGLAGVEVYREGFAFTLHIRVRDGARDSIGQRLHELVHPHPLAADLASAALLEQRLLFGLEFADGRRASTIDQPSHLDAAEPASGADASDARPIVLMPQGGGGGDRSHHQAYWVWPLPSPGPITFVVAWPCLGIPETRTTVDAAVILEAASRAVELWAWEPPRRPQVNEVRHPRPTEGWFASTEGQP